MLVASLTRFSHVLACLGCQKLYVVKYGAFSWLMCVGHNTTIFTFPVLHGILFFFSFPFVLDHLLYVKLLLKIFCCEWVIAFVMKLLFPIMGMVHV